MPIKELRFWDTGLEVVPTTIAVRRRPNPPGTQYVWRSRTSTGFCLFVHKGYAKLTL